MKKGLYIFFITLFVILLLIAAGSCVTSFAPHNPDMAALKSVLYKQSETQFRNILYFDIAKLEKYRDKYYVVYYFTCPAGTSVPNMSKPVNPDEPLNFVGICRVSTNPNNQFDIEKNTLVLAQTAINHLEIYDRDMGINIVGGKIRKPAIKQMRIRFANSEILQSRVEANGSFIFIYNPDKYFSGNMKEDIYYTQVVERFEGIDENNKVVSKVLFNYTSR